MSRNTGRFKAGPRIVALNPTHLEALAADLRAFGITSDTMRLYRRLSRVSRQNITGHADDPQ